MHGAVRFPRAHASQNRTSCMVAPSTLSTKRAAEAAKGSTAARCSDDCLALRRGAPPTIAAMSAAPAAEAAKTGHGHAAGRRHGSESVACQDRARPRAASGIRFRSPRYRPSPSATAPPKPAMSRKRHSRRDATDDASARTAATPPLAMHLHGIAFVSTTLLTAVSCGSRPSRVDETKNAISAAAPRIPDPATTAPPTAVAARAPPGESARARALPRRSSPRRDDQSRDSSVRFGPSSSGRDRSAWTDRRDGACRHGDRARYRAHFGRQ